MAPPLPKREQRIEAGQSAVIVRDVIPRPTARSPEPLIH